MKLHFFKSTFAILVAMAATQSAHAVYTAGNEDLILSFADPSVSNVLQVDIGSITNFTGPAAFYTLNLDKDLSAIFGSNFYNDANLNFSVAGTNSSLSTVNGYAKYSTFVSDPTSSPLNALSQNGLATPKTSISELYSVYNPAPASGSTPNSDILPSAEVNSYTNAYANGTFRTGGTVTTTFGQALPPTLALDILTPNSSVFASNAAGTPYQFSISPLGQLTYSVVAVPEPSTYALMALAFAGLVCVYRRKSVSNL